MQLLVVLFGGWPALKARRLRPKPNYGLIFKAAAPPTGQHAGSTKFCAIKHTFDIFNPPLFVIHQSEHSVCDFQGLESLALSSRP